MLRESVVLNPTLYQNTNSVHFSGIIERLSLVVQQGGLLYVRLSLHQLDVGTENKK